MNYKLAVYVRVFRTSRLLSTHTTASLCRRVNWNVRCRRHLWVRRPRRPCTRGGSQCPTTDTVTVINSSWLSTTPTVLIVTVQDSAD